MKTACKDCGVIIDVERFDDNHQYACPRCHTVFYRPGQPLELVLVMAITACLFFIPALFLPILTIHIMGQVHSVTLLEAVWFFASDGYLIIAIIAAGAGIMVPLSLLGLMMMMIIPLKLGHKAKKVRGFYRLYEHLSHWAMAEVYLVSIFVAIIKLSGMAELDLDFGLYSFGFFLITFFISINWFNPDDIWKQNAVA